MTTNGNGYAKRLHLYATALAALVAMTISIVSYMREIKDDKARQQAGEGLNTQQTTIAALRASVEFNRQLLLRLYFPNPAAGPITPEPAPEPRERPAPGPRRPPETDDNAHRPPVDRPRLIPPDELFKKAPPIPRQEKRDWKDYEQRQR